MNDISLSTKTFSLFDQQKECVLESQVFFGVKFHAGRSSGAWDSLQLRVSCFATLKSIFIVSDFDWGRRKLQITVINKVEERCGVVGSQVGK
jgi:hypothetical protein